MIEQNTLYTSTDPFNELTHLAQENNLINPELLQSTLLNVVYVT